jgi:negative regulator of sigma E activity
MRPVDPALDAALSAVMDGAATAADWVRVNAAWATDPALRERWALWHAAGDGLRSAELPALHRAPESLLAGLHARLPVGGERAQARRSASAWLPPLAVAASFVALAMGLAPLHAPPAADARVAQAVPTAWLGQGLAGASFAQTAAGRTLPAVVPDREGAWLMDPAPDTAAWETPPPAVPAASR